jgi:hypothetical protein
VDLVLLSYQSWEYNTFTITTMINDFPWGVFTILCCGLTFTAYIIYYILRLANEEMKNETTKSDSIHHKSHN